MGTLIFPSNTGGISVTPNPQEIYVDANVGDDTTGTGSVVAPYKTIQHALTFTTDPTKIYTLILACANYSGADSTIPGNVNIEGNGASIQFNLTLGSVGLVGSQIQPFYVTCGFQEFTFDLSPFSIALPTFDNCGIAKLIRTDTSVGAYIIRFSDGSCTDFSIKGNVAFDNTLFVGLGTVETGGVGFFKNTIIGIQIDLDAGSQAVLLSDVFVAPGGTLNALDPSAVVLIDSASASGFGGTIMGTTNINYLDNAQTIKYIPTTSSDWSTIPDTVQEGLDYLASISAFTPSPIQIYVDEQNGDDTTGNGSIIRPYKTIQFALGLTSNPLLIYNIFIAKGTYIGANSNINGNVSLFGSDCNIAFNLTLDTIFLAGSNITPVYNNCNFTDFTFDLSPFGFASATFNNCEIQNLIRTDLTSGNIIEYNGGIIENFDLTENTLFTNTTIRNLGFIQSGLIVIKDSICKIPTINISPNANLTIFSTYFSGTINADVTSTINIDSTSYSGFSGVINGTPIINFLDNAPSLKYNPTTPTDWGVVPTTVQEGLDNLASSVIFIYNSGRIFTQTSDSAIVTNTTTETSIVGSGEGSLSVPASGFAVGDSYQVNIAGHLNSKNNDQLTLRVKTAGGIVFTTFTVIMPTCTNQHFDLKINFTIRQIGGAGVSSIATTTLFTFTKDANNTFEGENVSTINNTTFDTTIANTLDVTAQWNVADPLNSIYTEIFTLFKTY